MQFLFLFLKGLTYSAVSPVSSVCISVRNPDRDCFLYVSLMPDYNEIPHGFYHRHFIISFGWEYSDLPLYTYSSISAPTLLNSALHQCPPSWHRWGGIRFEANTLLWRRVSHLVTLSLRVAHVAPTVFLYTSLLFSPLCLSTVFCSSLLSVFPLLCLCVLLSLLPACEPVSSSCGNPSHSLAPQPPDSPLYYYFFCIPPSPPPLPLFLPVLILLLSCLLARPLHCIRAWSRKSLAEKSSLYYAYKPLLICTAYFSSTLHISLLLCTVAYFPLLKTHLSS